MQRQTKRRSDAETIKDICEFAVYAPKKLTWITQSCNTNFQIVKKLLDRCLANKLIEAQEAGYLTTPKGKLYVKMYYTTMQMIGDKVEREFIIKSIC